MSLFDPLDPTLAAWLDSGPTALPDVTRQAIAAGVGGTRQRRPRPGVRVRPGAPSRFQVLGIAAALVGVTILGVLAATGGPDPSPREGPAPASPTPDARQATDTVSFTSPLYGYTLRHPAEWTAEPATETWTGGAWATLDATADVLFAGSVRPRISLEQPWHGAWFSAKAITVAPGTTATSWAEANVPLRAEQTLDGGTVCRYGNSYIPGGGPRVWTDTTIGGQPGRIRAACGFADAVVVVDGRAFVFSTYTYRGGNMTDSFDAIASTITFATATVGQDPAAVVPFESDLYGYSLRYPAGWIAAAAVEPWSGDDWRAVVDVDDMFRRPFTTALPIPLWFSVRATDVPAGTTADAWAVENVYRRPELWEDGTGARRCRFGTSVVKTGWNDGWRDATVGGEPGRLRAACGFVDAVVVTGGRAYIFSSFWKRDGGGDTRPFEAIAQTVVFQDASGGTTPFVSDVYGYAARYPAGWTVERATRPWIPGELPSRTPLSDRFEDPDLARSRIVVASAEMPVGLSEAAWRALRLPSRQRCGLGGLLGRIGTWETVTIDGREGKARAGCGSIDAVVVADRRAYVVTVTGPFHFEGATVETRSIFDAFVATMKLAPEQAVAPSPSP